MRVNENNHKGVAGHTKTLKNPVNQFKMLKIHNVRRIKFEQLREQNRTIEIGLNPMRKNPTNFNAMVGIVEMHPFHSSETKNGKHTKQY